MNKKTKEKRGYAIIQSLTLLYLFNGKG